LLEDSKPHLIALEVVANASLVQKPMCSSVRTWKLFPHSALILVFFSSIGPNLEIATTILFDPFRTFYEQETPQQA
jgi:hypothetical protein